MEALYYYIYGTVGILIGFYLGWHRGALVGYKTGAVDTEKNIFKELVKLKQDGII